MSKAANAILALSRAFYGKRLEKKQYDELIALKSVGEVVSYLKSKTAYSSVLENLGPNASAAAAESALGEYSFKKFVSLCRYELAIGSEFYKYFTVKTEVEQILHCILLLNSNAGESYLLQLDPFMDKHLGIDLYALGRAKTVLQVQQALEKTPYKRIIALCLASPDTSYLTFEYEFNRYFENYKQKLIKDCFSGGEQAAMREIVSRQADMTYIQNRYRIIKYYQTDDAMTKLSLPTVSTLTLFSPAQIDQISHCKDENEFLQILQKSPYKAFFKSAESIENQAYEAFYSYCRRHIRFSGYPGVVMYSYMFLAQAELTNLVRIIEGIKYGIPPEQIRLSLVGTG